MNSSILFIVGIIAGSVSAGADPQVQIGRLKLSCDRHSVSAPPWTDKIQEAEDPCKSLRDDIRTAHEEYSKLMKKAGEKESEVAAKAVKGGTDAKSMVKSAMDLCDSAAQEYDQAAKAAKTSADTLKEKYAKNEKALGAMKKRMPELFEAERSRRVQVQKLTNMVNRAAASTDAAELKRVEEMKAQATAIAKEKAPLDRVLKEEYYPKAIDEQGKVITSARAMEKLMREAERENQTKKADMLAKKEKLAAIKLDTDGQDAGKQVSEIVSAKAPETPKAKESVWEKLSKYTKSDPVPADIAKKEGQALSELKAASAPEPEAATTSADNKAEGKKPTAGASKLTEDVFDDVYGSETPESRLAREGALHSDKVGQVALDPEANTEKKVTDVNGQLTEATVEKYKADEAKLGPGGLHEKSKEVLEGLSGRSQNIEELSKNYPQDIHTGKMQKVGEDSPYFEQQEKISAAVKERNEYLARECENTAVCATVTDAGVKREISEDDITRKKTGNMAAAMRGDRYLVKDGSREALAEISAPGAAEEVSQKSASRIARLEGDSVKQQERAEGVAALREHEAVMDQKYVERGVTPIGGGDQAIRVESQKLITDNSAAAGIVNANATDEKTKDELGGAFRGIEERRQAHEVLEYLPGGSALKAVDSYDAYGRASVQADLLPESTVAGDVKKQTKETFEKDATMAIGGAAVGAATGGMGNTISGAIVKKAIDTKLESGLAGALERGVAKEMAFSAERSIGRAAEAEMPAMARASSAAGESFETAAPRFSSAEVKLESEAAAEAAAQDTTVARLSGEAAERDASFWQDGTKLQARADKIAEGYSEEAALAKFSAKDQGKIEAVRENVRTLESKLDTAVEKVNAIDPDKNIPKKLSNEVLSLSRKHAEELNKLAKITGREDGQIVRLAEEVSDNGHYIPDRYVYEMSAASKKAELPSGLAQHDNFLRQMPDYRVQFDPVRNAAQGTNAVELSSEKLLSVKSAKIDFSRRNFDVTTLHEAIHGRSFAKVDEGLPSVYEGSFRSFSGDHHVGPAGYKDYASMEEMATYRMETKSAQSAARDAAVLREAGKPIPKNLEARLDDFGIKMSEIGPTGNIEKDFHALDQYRGHAEVNAAHMRAIENRIQQKGIDAYDVHPGPHGEDLAVFHFKDAQNRDIARTEIAIPNKEKYFVMGERGPQLDRNLRHAEVQAQVEKMRANAEFHYKDSMELTKKSAPKIAAQAEANRYQSIFDAQAEQEILEGSNMAKKMGKKAVGKGAERRKGADQQIGDGFEVAPARAQAGPSAVPHAHAARDLASQGLLAKVSDTVKTTFAAVRTTVSGAVEKVQQALLGTAPNPLRQADNVASAITSPKLPSAVSAMSEPATAPPAGAAPAASIASPSGGAPSSIPPGYAQNSPAGGAGATDVSDFSARAVGGAKDLSGIGGGLAGGAGGAGGGGAVGMPDWGGRMPASAPGQVATSSDVSGVSNSANALVAVATPAVIAGAGALAVPAKNPDRSLVGTSVRVGSAPAPGTGITNSGNNPALVAGAGKKKTPIRDLSLKEKLLQQLRESESAGGERSDGSLPSLITSAHAAEDDAVTAVSAPGAPGAAHADHTAQATAAVKDSETSLFLRIRKMHIKYLEHGPG